MANVCAKKATVVLVATNVLTATTAIQIASRATVVSLVHHLLVAMLVASVTVSLTLLAKLVTSARLDITTILNAFVSIINFLLCNSTNNSLIKKINSIDSLQL